MNKKVMGKKFSRDTTSRRAMYRALVRSFVLNRSLTTTYAKAKVIIPIIDKLIIKAKGKTISDKRFVYSFCANDRDVATKLYELSKNLASVKGSYLRYVNLPSRKGDNAPMARVEFAEKLVEKETNTDNKLKAAGKGDLKKTSQEPVKSDKKPSVKSMINKLSLKRKTK